MCQNAETECYPFWNPQPVKLAEKRSDALRTPDGEYKSSSGVENALQPVQQLTGDAGQH